VSAFSHPRSRAGSLAYRSRERAPSRYRTLSAAAANVASAAAALATQRNEPSTSPRISARYSRRSLDGLVDNDRRRSRQDDDDVDDDALAMLGESFHSDWSGRHKPVFPSKESQPVAGHSRSRSRQPIPSSSIPAALQITSTTDDLDPSTRGRSLQRANRASLESRGEHTWLSGEEGSQGRRSPRASRRGAAMVFMGAWALFGIGTLGIRGNIGERGVGVLPGKVLSPSGLTPFSLPSPSPTHESSPLTTVDLVFNDPHFEDMSKDRPPAAGPPMERVIGRISAWMCTTLYLTSRLPQIWKNVRV
jgi:solute carrier family 66 (lysosomal lysine-arginine transporter), member 1